MPKFLRKRWAVNFECKYFTHEHARYFTRRAAQRHVDRMNALFGEWSGFVTLVVREIER